MIAMGRITGIALWLCCILILPAEAISEIVEVTGEGKTGYYDKDGDIYARGHAVDQLKGLCKKKGLKFFTGHFKNKEYIYAWVKYNEHCKENAKGEKACTTQATGYCFSMVNDRFIVNCGKKHDVDGRVELLPHGAMRLRTEDNRVITFSPSTMRQIIAEEQEIRNRPPQKEWDPRISEESQTMVKKVCDYKPEKPSVYGKVMSYIKNKYQKLDKKCEEIRKKYRKEGGKLPKECQPSVSHKVGSPRG